METKHTPGPWVATPSAHKQEWSHWIDGSPRPPHSARSNLVAAVANEDGAEANARLIAAAPELLTACKTLVRECESMGRASHTSAAIDALYAAIAKAEGEAT